MYVYPPAVSMSAATFVRGSRDAKALAFRRRSARSVARTDAWWIRVAHWGQNHSVSIGTPRQPRTKQRRWVGVWILMRRSSEARATIHIMLVHISDRASNVPRLTPPDDLAARLARHVAHGGCDARVSQPPAMLARVIKVVGFLEFQFGHDESPWVNFRHKTVVMGILLWDGWDTWDTLSYKPTRSIK
jgi:hypothetical protein